jgi:hypothetical protein
MGWRKPIMFGADAVRCMRRGNGGGGGGSHIYWRQYITRTRLNSGYRIEAAEIEFLNGGEDLCITVGGIPSGSPQYSTFTIDLAFDRVLSSAFLTSQYEEGDLFIQFEFNTPVEVTEFAYTCEDSSNRIDRTPKDFEIQFSDDGVNWTTVFSVVDDANFTTVSERRLYTW